MFSVPKWVLKEAFPLNLALLKAALMCETRIATAPPDLGCRFPGGTVCLWRAGCQDRRTNHECVCHMIYVMCISFTANLHIHWSFFFLIYIFHHFLFQNSHSLLSSMLSVFFVYHFMRASHEFHNDNVFTCRMGWLWGVVWEVEFVGFSVVIIVWAFCVSQESVQVKTRLMFLPEVN